MSVQIRMQTTYEVQMTKDVAEAVAELIDRYLGADGRTDGDTDHVTLEKIGTDDHVCLLELRSRLMTAGVGK